MTVALIMVTKDFYLKNGLLYFSSQDEEYKCFEFSGRASVYEAVQQYNYVYIVCDNNNYFLYSLLFSGGPVKCICADNITINMEIGYQLIIRIHQNKFFDLLIILNERFFISISLSGEK